MSRAAEVELQFGGEQRLFKLPIGRLRALQEAVDAGPYEIYLRLMNGSWRVDDVRATIREGLVGSGMTTFEADRLLKNEFDDLPIIPFLPTAQAILLAVLSGVEDEQPGEQKAGAEKKTRRSRATKSASPDSTA